LSDRHFNSAKFYKHKYESADVMFNYKSPLSRLLEKPAAKVENDVPQHAETDALDLQTLRETLSGAPAGGVPAEYHEDIEDLAPVNETGDTKDVHAEDLAKDATEKPDFLVLQSVFDDAEMVKSDNIFAESIDIIDAVPAAVEIPAEPVPSILTLVPEASETVIPVARQETYEPVATPAEIVMPTLEGVDEEYEEDLVEEDLVAASDSVLELSEDSVVPNDTGLVDQLLSAMEMETPEPAAEAASFEPSEPLVSDLQAIEPQSTEQVVETPVPAVPEPVIATPEPAIAEPVPVIAETADPQPAAPVAKSRRRDRIKTTFLGLEHADNRLNDLISAEPVKKAVTVNTFPVGWLVITDGPGRGACLTLTEGLLQIGRNDDQALQLDFGDNGISRSSHAVVAYDSEERKCFLGHGGKANLVRLNGSPVLSTVPMTHGDTIRISETTMRFVSFCDQDFDWRDKT